jgi:hypothetical protein
MKPRNYYVYNADESVLKTLQEEYESMGRSTKIEGNRLCVFARVVKPVVKKKVVDRKPKAEVESVERSREQRPKRKE